MIKIAVLGCGTVGSGVCRLIKENAEDISRRLGDDLQVARVLELDFERPRALGFSDSQITSDINEILNDDDIQIVVETMGGVDVPFGFIMACMEHGKHIVTSNKDLVERRWDELYAQAARFNVDFCFEAAVGGGIPVILPIKSSLAANHIFEIIGILNGTTNYILTRMAEDGLSYSEALLLAQRGGFAESNPHSDISGADAARKIAILSRLAFNIKIELSEVYCEGITDIDAQDIKTARDMGYAVKLIAAAYQKDGMVAASVRPALVPVSHPIASVNNEYNAVLLRGDASDDVMFYGKGAGSLPTASAVVGDVVAVGRGLLRGAGFSAQSLCYRPKVLQDIGETSHQFYLRLLVDDRPRVLETVAAAFGAQDVSISSVTQRTAGDGQARLVIITHTVKERQLRAALDTLMQNDHVFRMTAMVCFE